MDIARPWVKLKAVVCRIAMHPPHRLTFLALRALVLAALCSIPTLALAQATSPFVWTVLQPEHDSRDADVRSFDEFDSKSFVEGMNQAEPIFRRQLTWNKAALKDLLAVTTPFGELRFDAVKPLILTTREKTVLREFFARGGFVFFEEDAYPYAEDEFWKVKSWPVIDFLTKELPARDPNFKVEKVTDAHPLFHQYYSTQSAEWITHELKDNPYTPNRTLVTYRGHPCAFVMGRYYVIEDGKWIAEPRPYAHVYNHELRGYQLTVNLYVYATMH